MTFLVRLKHFPVLERRSQYKAGTQHQYSIYRLEIQEDCQFRCVYCDAHEKEIGGESMFHLDHFRPQKLFPHLTHDPKNLVWACCRCNLLKRAHWPASGLADDETINGEQGFLDPFNVDRKDYFIVLNEGKLDAIKSPGTYLIDKLALNRSFLCLNRYKRKLIQEIWLDLNTKEIETKEEKKQYEQRFLNNDFTNKDYLQTLISSCDKYLKLIEVCRQTILTLF